MMDNRGNVKLTIFLIIVLLAVIFGILYMLEKIGMIDISNYIMPQIVKIPYIGSYFAPKIVTGGMLKEEELTQVEMSLNNREKALADKEKALKIWEDKLKQKETELNGKEQDIFLREQAEKRRKEEEDNKDKKLNQMAFYYKNMKPADAARKLELLDAILAADILNRIPEKTTIAIILSKMSDEKSKEITRFMIKSEQ